MTSKYKNNKTPEQDSQLWFNTEGLRRCCTCNVFKDEDSFHLDKNKFNRAYSCKECANARTRAAHKHRMEHDPSYKLGKKNNYIRNRYGFSLQEYEERLKAQGDGCGICGKPFKGYPHLDHNHTTGAIREFLCGYCNRGIGLLQEDTTILSKAIMYLNKHNDSAEIGKAGTSP